MGAHAAHSTRPPLPRRRMPPDPQIIEAQRRRSRSTNNLQQMLDLDHVSHSSAAGATTMLLRVPPHEVVSQSGACAAVLYWCCLVLWSGFSCGLSLHTVLTGRFFWAPFVSCLVLSLVYVDMDCSACSHYFLSQYCPTVVPVVITARCMIWVIRVVYPCFLLS